MTQSTGPWHRQNLVVGGVITPRGSKQYRLLQNWNLSLTFFGSWNWTCIYIKKKKWWGGNISTDLYFFVLLYYTNLIYKLKLKDILKTIHKTKNSSPHFPLRRKVDQLQLSKRNRVLCWSIYICMFWSVYSILVYEKTESQSPPPPPPG